MSTEPSPDNDEPTPSAPSPKVHTQSFDLRDRLGIWDDTTESIFAVGGIARPAPNWGTPAVQERIRTYGPTNVLVWSSGLLAVMVARTAYEGPALRDVFETQRRTLEQRLFEEAWTRELQGPTK